MLTDKNVTVRNLDPNMMFVDGTRHSEDTLGQQLFKFGKMHMTTPGDKIEDCQLLRFAYISVLENTKRQTQHHSVPKGQAHECMYKCVDEGLTSCKRAVPPCGLASTMLWYCLASVIERSPCNTKQALGYCMGLAP